MTDRRRLSDDDIEAICTAIVNIREHQCRFTTLTPEEVSDAVRFHKHVNDLMSETGSTIRKTVLVSGIGGLLALLILGAYTKLKQVVLPGP